MTRVQFIFDKNSEGRSDFADFLDSLPKNERIKLVSVIKKIQEVGLQEAFKMQWAAKLEDNLYEIRTRIGKEYLRGIYFHFEANQYVITHGFKKESDKTPSKELEKGRQRRDRFMENNN
ncbi:type II toxin-antitoxin system RelE/ParE family toxin [Oenococcus sp.]|uniref:type II toxin-antitoxin system RelE/ParE family toxin n=1 Tax=Oenococcus sp. TaxID=1979414 RepID=UPI0039ECF489